MTKAGEVVTDVGPVAVELAEPESQTEASLTKGDPANDWLCATCHNRVASERDRFSYEGKSELSFANPERVRFEIILFLETIGCREAGSPTLEHTWFPGHAWSYCVCERCRMHLGWYYTGPSVFAGLIHSRIVRATLVRN